MSTTFTTKYGLIKPTPGTSETVNVADLNLNSDTIDAALGAQVVNDGVVVPPASIRDGMIVSEKTTGICYVLVKNNVGGFDKRFLSSPYLFVASTPAATGSGSASYQPRGYTSYSGGINSTAADLVGTLWKAPFTGIFMIRYQDHWSASNPGVTQSSALGINGSIDAPNTESVTAGNGATNQSTQNMFIRSLAKNDVVNHYIFIQPSNSITVYSTIEITCIQRLA